MARRSVYGNKAKAYEQSAADVEPKGMAEGSPEEEAKDMEAMMMAHHVPVASKVKIVKARPHAHHTVMGKGMLLKRGR